MRSGYAVANGSFWHDSEECLAAKKHRKADATNETGR